MMKFIIGVCMILNVYISAQTNALIAESIESELKKWAKHYKVEYALVKAIAKKESDLCTVVPPRYEAHLPKAGWYNKLLPKRYQKDPFSYCSMGTMQVLYGIARSEGFTGQPYKLSSPTNSIKYGVKFLKGLIDSYYDIEKVVSFYNAGPHKRKDGKFRNHDNYVVPVFRYYKKYGGVIKTNY